MSPSCPISVMETLIVCNSLFPSFFFMFCLIYLIGYSIVFRNWNPKYRPDASSCFISLFHGTPAVLLAVFALLTQPSWSFASPNTEFDNLVLDFSIAYFTVDLLHYLILIPTDYLFIAHHLATLFVFITCRYLVLHGSFALLVLLVLAEVTSPFQNIWTLSGLRETESADAAELHQFLSLPFYTLYTIMRGFAGPLFFYKMSAYYFSGKADDVIPSWVSILWVIIIGSAIGVSILWISNHWAELHSERGDDAEKKQR
ncbi:putative TLC domain-containing protein [Dioscorea sansibarensis]